MRRRRWNDLSISLVLAAIAGSVRLPAIGRPDELVFDEAFYVNDALRYLGQASGEEVSWVHPPLGKWLIASGISIVGDTPAGWRVAAALAGIATVVLTFLVAVRILPRWAATSAAVFVAFDGLAIVHSRISMLDGFLTPFLLGAVLAIMPDSRDEDEDGAPGLGQMATAGACLGAAVAIKWAAAPALAALIVVVAIRWRPRGRQLVTVVGCLVLLPAAIYAASYARFWADGGSVSEFVRLQRWMLEFHQNLTARHPYGSSATSWLLLRRPVAYYFEAEGGRVREVLAIGNPALWWGFVAASPLLVVRWWRQRDPAVELVVLAVAVLYLPWVVTFRQGFLFYLTPLVPFLAIGLAAALVAVTGSRPSSGMRPVPAVVVIATVVVVGVLYLPLWLGSPISQDRWDMLILFDRWI